jgi:hypothetical protein
MDLNRVRKGRRHLLARLVEETHDDDHGRDRAVEVEQSELMRQLRRLERYERRALARRRRATAAFDPSLVQAVRRRA